MPTRCKILCTTCSTLSPRKSNKGSNSDNTSISNKLLKMSEISTLEARHQIQPLHSKTWSKPFISDSWEPSKSLLPTSTSSSNLTSAVTGVQGEMSLMRRESAVYVKSSASSSVPKFFVFHDQVFSIRLNFCSVPGFKATFIIAA